MLRWIILAIVVVAISAVATIVVQYGPMSDAGPSPNLAAPEAAGPQPKIDVPEKLVYNFGTMAQQDKGTHSWVVKNVGAADLEMWMVSSTCSCTIAKLRGSTGGEKKTVVITPGDSTTIDLEWETRNNTNEYRKGATIGTNDRSRPSFSLEVKGKVFPPLMMYPPDMITLNGISNEEAFKTFVVVFSMDRPNTKINKINSSRPEFILTKYRPLTQQELKQLRVPGGVHVDVEIKPGLPEGHFQEELLIETDHPKQPELKVKIAGKCDGPITIVPEKVRMTDVLGTEGKTQNLTVLVQGAKATKFEVAHQPANVNVTIAANETEAKKGRYRLTVAVPPGAPAGLVEDEIILKTDNPKARVLKIPVTIVISNVGAS
jgi:hypothetical protein